MDTLFIVAMIGVLTGPHAEGYDLHERTEYYEVYGNTAGMLTQQMSHRGPVHSGGRAWAFTHWELRTLYALNPTSAGCRIESPRVRLEIVTTLPRWNPGSAAPWQLRADWKRLMASIRQHEDVHRAHALAAADRTVVALELAPVAPDCAAAERQVQAITRHESARGRNESLAFDRDTRFGAREGVRLGP